MTVPQAEPISRHPRLRIPILGNVPVLVGTAVRLIGLRSSSALDSFRVTHGTTLFAPDQGA